MKRFRLWVCVLCVSVFMVACGGTQVKNVSTSVMMTSDMKAGSIEDAIIKAGMDRGWNLKKEAPGSIEAVLNVRTHRAVVKIAYTADGYTINYADSTNLEYNPNNNTIHNNYNKWVMNLDQTIKDCTTVAACPDSPIRWGELLLTPPRKNDHFFDPPSRGGCRLSGRSKRL